MPKKILIVEDEANIRELLRLYLEREGYAVIEAENGVEGIKMWKSEKPDMLLLDVMMPVMDGWAVCKEIRAESDVPIIMLTAKGETADRVSGLEMGADDYIVKPLEMPDVPEELSDALVATIRALGSDARRAVVLKVACGKSEPGAKANGYESLPCWGSAGPDRSKAKHALDALIACEIVGQKPGEKRLCVMVRG